MKYFTTAERTIINPIGMLISKAIFQAVVCAVKLIFIFVRLLVCEGDRDENKFRGRVSVESFSGLCFYHVHLFVLKIASFMMNAFSFSQGTIPRGANHLRVELEAVNLACRSFHSEHPVPRGVSTNFGSLLGTGVGRHAHDLHQNSENRP